MNLKHITLAVVAALGGIFSTPKRRVARNVPTRDTGYMAFQYRMGAGFPGDVNRTHPASIIPGITDATDPPERYGATCVVNTATSTLRQLKASDASDSVDLTPYGAIVRPYPYQTPNEGAYGAVGFGAGTPPTRGQADFLTLGYIMVQLNTGSAQPVKGGRVFVWTAADSGDHKQGGYETAALSGNTVRLDERYTYNGPGDANGIVEIAYNVGGGTG